MVGHSLALIEIDVLLNAMATLPQMFPVCVAPLCWVKQNHGEDTEQDHGCGDEVPPPRTGEG